MVIISVNYYFSNGNVVKTIINDDMLITVFFLNKIFINYIYYVIINKNVRGYV